MADDVMTVGELARRTGMSLKLIRRLTDLGLIYSPGRSAANYRLYDASALWCVEVVTELRGLGLTIAEITRLGRAYLDGPDGDVRPLLDEMVEGARRRIVSQIERLGRTLDRQRGALTPSDRLTALGRSDPARG